MNYVKKGNTHNSPLHFIVLLLPMLSKLPICIISVWQKYSTVMCEHTFLPDSAFCDVMLAAWNWLPIHHFNGPYSHSHVQQRQCGNFEGFTGAIKKAQCVKCRLTPYCYTLHPICWYKSVYQFSIGLSLSAFLSWWLINTSCSSIGLPPKPKGLRAPPLVRCAERGREREHE